MGNNQPDTQTNSELLQAIEKANDKLAAAMESAQTYAKHDKVRPSAIRALNYAEEAHHILTEVNITRSSDE